MLLASFAILIILLIYSDFFKVLQILASSNLYFVALGFLFWFLGAIVRSLRWQKLLKVSNVNLSFKDTLHVYIPSLFISNISPAKSGDALRPFLLKGMKNKSVAKSLPSVFVERILDIAVLIIFSLFGIFYFGKSIVSYFVISIFIYLIVFVFGSWILISEKRTKIFLEKFLFLFKKIKTFRKFVLKVDKFSRTLSSSFLKYKSFGKFFSSLILTFFVWFIEGIILWIAFKTINIEVSFFVCLFSISISVLVSVITFLPGGLGINEAIILLIFSSLYKLTPAQIMAGMILSRLYAYWPYVFIGAIIASFGKYKF